MHSVCRNSGSKTFFTITTFPSATEVTRRSFSASGASRLGTRKNQVMNTMKVSSTTITGMVIQRFLINVADRNISTAHTIQLKKIVP